MNGDVLQLCQWPLKCPMPREVVQKKQYMSARGPANVEVQRDQPSAEDGAGHPGFFVAEVVDAKLLWRLLLEDFWLLGMANEKEIHLLCARGVAGKDQVSVDHETNLLLTINPFCKQPV